MFPTREKTNKILNIPMELILPCPHQARRYFEREAMEKLTASVRQYGVLVPLLVRPAKHGKYELISGQRRYRACVRLNLPTVPAILCRVSEEQAAIMALNESVQQAPLTAWEKAEGYRDAMKLLHISEQELARRIGQPPSEVLHKLKIGSLPEETKQNIREQGMGESCANALSALAESDRERVLRSLAERRNIAREAERRERAEQTEKEQRAVQAKTLFMPVRKGSEEEMQVVQNTIRKAARMIRRTGAETNTAVKDCGDRTEYIITVEK